MWRLPMMFVPLLAQALQLPAAAAADTSFAMGSPDIAEGRTLDLAQVYGGHGCGGGDHSPALAWTAPPPGTRSIAVTAFDPDARGGKGWWHWAVIDLPVELRRMPDDAGKPNAAKVPPGAKQGKNSFGAEGYSGACPPPGDAPHRYEFTVWALGSSAPFAAGADDEAIAAWLSEHALAKARIVARYGR